MDSKMKLRTRLKRRKTVEEHQITEESMTLSKAHKQNNSNGDSDAETVYLGDKPRRSKLSVRRNEDQQMATLSESEGCSSTSSDDNSSTSTVRLEISTVSPQGYQVSQITGESSDHQMEGTQNARRKSSPSNSQSPHVIKKNHTSELVDSSSNDDEGPIIPSSLSKLPSCIQLTKIQAQKTEKFTAAKQRKIELCLSKTMALPSNTQLQSSTPKRLKGPLNKPSLPVIPRGISVSVLPKRIISEVSITPRTQKRRAKPEAVPEVTKLLTIDLTEESSSRRKSSVNHGSVMVKICRVCDKTFHSLKEVSQHMICHRNVQKHICKNCNAEFPSHNKLHVHCQSYHAPAGHHPDMAIPVVDMGQPGVLHKLGVLGMRFLIPLAQLHSASKDGKFGLPVVAIDATSNPTLCNIGEMGASNLLPVGPLKNLEFNH